MARGADPSTSNILYYGDNLDILRERIGPSSVDLLYLDPPFNSNRSYNVLFGRQHGGAGAQAQIHARVPVARAIRTGQGDGARVLGVPPSVRRWSPVKKEPPPESGVPSFEWGVTSSVATLAISL